MVSYYDKVRRAANQQGNPPVIAKLQGVYDALDDTELLRVLQGKLRRGCKGYSVDALWHSYLIAYVQNIPTVRGLIRALENNPALCKVAGINPFVIPSEATYSRFVAKLSKHNDLVQETLNNAVQTLTDNLDGFGKVVAIDSTDVRAYSKGVKNSDVKRASDPDAAWGAKKKHGGPYFWFGYKVHMVSDANYELPIHVEVTPANVSDYQGFIPPLRNANINPDYVLADAGYDSKANYAFVADELQAIPVIDMNKRGKRRNGRVPKRSKAELRLFDLRENPGIDRGSNEWKRLYDRRVSVERLFSRMKEFRRLGSIHHRGLAKVTLHAYISTLTVVTSAVAAISTETPLRQVA